MLVNARLLPASGLSMASVARLISSNSVQSSRVPILLPFSHNMAEKTTGYRLEYAASARAKCKECLSGPKPCSGTPIGKGELRFGTLIDMRGVQSFVWRHWGCVTKKILENVKKNFEEASELDGFEELRPEDQARVIKAWQEGHVADEDIPESARKPEGEQEEKPKKATKKVSKKKADESEGEAIPEEKPKKAKAGSSKKAAPTSEAEDEEKEEVEEKPKKKAPAKKAAEPKEKAAPKKRAPKKKKKAESNDESGEDFTKELDEVPASSDEEEEEEKPKKKAPAKKLAEKKERPKPEPKKKAAPKKKAEKEVEDDAEMANAPAAEGEDTEEGSSKKRKVYLFYLLHLYVVTTFVPDFSARLCSEGSCHQTPFKESQGSTLQG
ncbi:hypothetical protein CPB84DRAFT_360495 [Gymnopilus junonius]|uniref:PARP-type domain-containing protein n=1 Tax=Gymnopilus junonius TaxID=109634 RepID=A0A9P5NW91_GYMJU|nr:hypothetical protein CPB84DRAFT_360495 [Gymnopilus junonius]